MISVIFPSGSWTDIPQDNPPSDEYLQQLIGCGRTELVRVFYEGNYEQMIVDETGALGEDRTVNPTATDIYHENVRVHDPLTYDPRHMPSIYGIAVLLTKEHKVR